MNQLFPYPEAHPLERLRIYDSLVMNAKRWQLAHNYHCKRQSVLYQSLHQPGIVSGLEVTVLDHPPEGSNRVFQERDATRQEKRWLQIQPGVAIDHYGNPIIVDERTDRTYRIAFDALETSTRTVYVVVRYVDPEQLQYPQDTAEVCDLFRFDQRTDPPTVGEVEICRIELSPGRVELAIPNNPFAPELNQIDVRHRLQAQFRSSACLQIGALEDDVRSQIYYPLTALTQSLSALFPSLQAEVHSSTVHHHLVNYDILCVTPDLLNTKNVTLEQYLQEYDGTLLSIIPNDVTPDARFMAWKDLPIHHLVRSQPFLFTQLPESVNVWFSVAGNTILISQSLLTAWSGVDQTRDSIRTVHELGINLLQFIWRRRQLFQSLHSNP
jgi:hypothetical protein